MFFSWEEDIWRERYNPQNLPGHLSRVPNITMITGWMIWYRKSYAGAVWIYSDLWVNDLILKG